MRYHTTAEGNIPFTPEEEAEADALEYVFMQEKLSRIKQDKLNEVINKYNLEANKQVEFQGNIYHGGLDSSDKAKNKAEIIERFKEKNQDIPPYVLTFNDINHNTITMDTELLKDLSVSIRLSYEDAFHRKIDLRKKINALQTIEAINAFDVDAEWELSNGHRGE